MIDPACEAPLPELASLMAEVPAARLFEEVLKLFHAGYGLQAFEKLRHYGLFAQLFPATEACLARQEHEFPIIFVSRGLDNTDRRILDGKSVVPPFLFAVLLWEPVRLRYQELLDGGAAWADAIALASHEVASAQQRHVAIPKRFGMPMREIWSLQPRLERRQGRRPMALLGHPRFRAAYDFLLLRAEAGEVDPAVAEWWTQFQDANPGERAKMAGGGRKRRSRRRRKPEVAGGDGGEQATAVQGRPAGGDGDG
jgi:poly(A) polymerase